MILERKWLQFREKSNIIALYSNLSLEAKGGDRIVDIAAIRQLAKTAQTSSVSALSGADASQAFAQVLQKATKSDGMDAIFERASRETGLPVNLLKAVGKAESDFNPNCVSSAGAMGVMQLMPANCKEYGVTDPFDAEQNIMAGARHLRDYINRYDGDVRLGLAAYNAGPGNVDKYGGIPPFKETQNYVPRVLKYAGMDLGTIGAIPARTVAETGVGGAVGTLSENAELTDLLNALLPMLSQSVPTAQEQAEQLCMMMRMSANMQLLSAMQNGEEEQDTFSLPSDQQMRIHYMSL